jgi:hypothetical protein
MGIDRRNRDNVVTWRLAAVALGALVVSACEPYAESTTTRFIAEPARNALTATRPGPAQLTQTTPGGSPARGEVYGTSEGE